MAVANDRRSTAVTTGKPWSKKLVKANVDTPFFCLWCEPKCLDSQLTTCSPVFVKQRYNNLNKDSWCTQSTLPSPVCGWNSKMGVSSATSWWRSGYCCSRLQADSLFPGRYDAQWLDCITLELRIHIALSSSAVLLIILSFRPDWGYHKAYLSIHIF